MRGGKERVTISKRLQLLVKYTHCHNSQDFMTRPKPESGKYQVSLQGHGGPGAGPSFCLPGVLAGIEHTFQ